MFSSRVSQKLTAKASFAEGRGVWPSREASNEDKCGFRVVMHQKDELPRPMSSTKSRSAAQANALPSVSSHAAFEWSSIVSNMLRFVSQSVGISMGQCRINVELVSSGCTALPCEGRRQTHLRSTVSSLGFGRKSVQPACRDKADVAMFLPGLLRPDISRRPVL